MGVVGLSPQPAEVPPACGVPAAPGLNSDVYALPHSSHPHSGDPHRLSPHILMQGSPHSMVTLRRIPQPTGSSSGPPCPPQQGAVLALGVHRPRTPHNAACSAPFLGARRAPSPTGSPRARGEQRDPVCFPGAAAGTTEIRLAPHQGRGTP